MARNNNVHNHVIIEDSALARIKASRVSLTLMALGMAPLLWLFCVMSWGRPAYQFFPLALAGAAVLGWRALKQASSSSAPLPSPAVSGQSSVVRGPNTEVRSPESPWPARSLGLAAGLLFLLANALWSPWLGFVAFLLGLAAVLWSLGGKALVQAFVPVMLILLTILPPPLNGEVTLTLWLRSVAVNTSNSLLDWLQVTHAQDGNTLLLPGKTLLVEEACSGINSFILCNALCLFWGLWQRRSPWWFVFALPATSLFVVLGNIIRITAGAAAFYFRHVDLLSGRPHEIFGLVLLLGYCVLILSFDQCLVFLMYSSHSEPDTAAPQSRAADGQPAALPTGGGSPSLGEAESLASNPQCMPDPLTPRPPASPLGRFGFAGAAGLALVGIGFFAAHLFLGGRHGLAKLPSLSSVRELKFSMPASLAGWQRITADSGDLTWVQTMGVHSVDWSFQHNGLQVALAVDYPLDGFHNVKICYLNNGWQVQSEQELVRAPGGEDLHAIRLELQNATKFALVLHSVVNGQGDWLAPPRSVENRFTETVAAPQTGYRIQMISAGYAPLSPAAEADCLAFFMQARQLLLQQLVEQFGKAAIK